MADHIPGLAHADRSVLDRLFPLVYRELHALAGNYLAAERVGHTLQPTALVNESYLRLVEQAVVQVQDRQHCIAVAARAMRHVLVDHARRRGAQKRGGALQRVAVDSSILEAAGGLGARETEFLALHEALERLEMIGSLTAAVLELRFFGGLTVEQAAEVLGVSASTVEREWRFARAWLRDQLG